LFYHLLDFTLEAIIVQCGVAVGSATDFPDKFRIHRGCEQVAVTGKTSPLVVAEGQILRMRSR